MHHKIKNGLLMSILMVLIVMLVMEMQILAKLLLLGLTENKVILKEQEKKHQLLFN